MFVCPECASTADAAGACAREGAVRVDCRADPLLGAMVGNYRVARRIGSGGFGHVYLGVHPEIGSRVAVKVLAHDAASRPELVERFFGEARAVNHIRHPNIVSVLDLARLPDGRPFTLMELLEGQSLGARIRERGALEIGEALRMAGDALGALGAAHAAGIFHRDVKPDNLFVTRAGLTKVLDFGIAKLRPDVPGGGSPTTTTGSLMGTPHYMAPEQILGTPPDGRTDVYAFGVVLFEALSGAPPFDAPNVFTLLRLHLEAPVPSLAEKCPGIAPGVAAAVERAMAKEPAKRFASAADMARALGVAADAVSGVVASGVAVAPTVADVAVQPTVRSDPPPATPAQVPTVSGALVPLPAPTPLALSMPERPRGPAWWWAIALGVPLTVLVVFLGIYALRSQSDGSRPARNRDRTTAKRAAASASAPSSDDGWGLDDPDLQKALKDMGQGGEPFDLGQFIAEGQRDARKRFNDAELVEVMATRVDARGFAARELMASVTARFYSRIGNRCLTVTPLQTSAMESGGCGSPTTVRMPRCPLATIMKRARESAAVNESATAMLSYPVDGKPQWDVMFTGLARAVVDDSGCD